MTPTAVTGWSHNGTSAAVGLGSISGYSGGAVSLNVDVDADGFTLTADVGGYTSGKVLWSSFANGFTPSDLGNAAQLILTSKPGNSVFDSAFIESRSLYLSDAELDNVTTSSKIVVGDTSTGDVTFAEAIDMANADTLEIVTGGTVNDTGGSTVFTDTNLAIDAAQGVGTTSALDTAVSNFEGDGGMGGINLANTGDITLGNVAQSTIDGAFATNAPVTISAASSIDVVSPINSGGGDVNLTATEDINVQNGSGITGGGHVDVQSRYPAF